MVANGPLIVIVGETASGKSALAIKIAKRFNGEIICADSRTIYKGMDTGTAKPSAKERAQVPHHLLDVVNPDTKFSAAEFKRLANQKITDITKRGRLPIIVGGTGLYIDAIIFDFNFSPAGSARDPMNPRHLKHIGTSQVNKTLRPNTLVIGLHVERPKLEELINTRTEVMFKTGLIDEVKKLSSQYSWQEPGMQTIGYQEFRDYIEGNQTLEDTKTNIIKHTLQYAKRQRTWFKRNKSIHWLNDRSNVVEIVTTFLNKTLV
jgi:tRNA dimethylallyltransferase